MISKVYRGEAGQRKTEVWQPRTVERAFAALQSVRPSVRPGEESGHWERLLDDQSAAARQRGFEEGKTAGRQEAATQLQPVLERLARSAEEVASLRARLRHEAEADVVHLSMAIARRILNRELATDPEALLGLVRSALDKLDAREVHRVRAHPQHAAMLQQHLQTMGSDRQIQVVPDRSLAPGAAILETAHGSLDASVETQLAEVERGFADLMERVK